MPAIYAPVQQPALARGQDARAALARSREATAEANRRLVGARDWYGQVRRSYAEGGR